MTCQACLCAYSAKPCLYATLTCQIQGADHTLRGVFCASCASRAFCTSAPLYLLLSTGVTEWPQKSCGRCDGDRLACLSPDLSVLATEGPESEDPEDPEGAKALNIPQNV